MKKLILTVCNGNIHRSVIAEAVIRELLQERGLDAEYRVESRGIQGTGGVEAPKHRNIRDYPDEWKYTEDALKAFGIQIPADKVSTPVARADAEEASVILAMDDKTLNNPVNGLKTQFADLSKKMLLFTDLGNATEELTDLHGNGDPAVYNKVIRSIHDTISENFDAMLTRADR